MKKSKVVDPEVYTLLGIRVQKNRIADEEILERCLLPMINEATRCLDEGIVASAAAVDLAMIMGTGFPPFRGGLLRYADTLGPQTIADQLKKYESRFGPRFEPSPGLYHRAENGQKFHFS
jgi:3-hydroxyacyl-CoA dehydrogenase/enoyl-CoA hydratase/3-hydroxybutyryl-CoA epimerase